MEISWITVSEVDLERKYVALLCYMERKNPWSFFSYLFNGRSIQGQLKDAKGLIGYSLRLGFLDKKAIALSVWEDEESISKFAHAGKHSDAMTNLRPMMKWNKFVRWSISGSNIPPKWDDAIARLEKS